jgi:hypothetical protein
LRDAEAALTLNQISLTPAEARPVSQRLLHNVELLLELEWVHRALSAFDLLLRRLHNPLHHPEVSEARG